MSVLNNITTGIDNKTHDLVRIIMLVNFILLVPVLLFGIGFFLYGYLNTLPFPIHDFFEAVLTFEESVAGLMTTGAAALRIKKSTEPTNKNDDNMVQ